MINNPSTFLVTLKSFGERMTQGKVTRRQMDTVKERIANP
jgi:hypothetical protein